MRAIEQLWWRKAADEPAWTEAWAWPLTLASLPIRLGAALRMRLIEPKRSNAKVISVGNLAVGGAGKTPIAMKLCEILHARGRKPAVLSRGYGRVSRRPISIVCEGRGPLLSADEAGDEPLLIARRLPWLTVLVGPDRTLLAKEAEARSCDVLVLDDGLQQRALACDLDVIVLDAENPLGNGRRMPRGPLREGVEAFSRTGASGLLWLSNARDQARRAPELAALLEEATRSGLRGPVESAATATCPPEMLGMPTFLLAGIARPERFEQSARSAGLQIRGARFFSDHHRFTEAELGEVRAAALGAGAKVIATTEKDAARLSKDQLQGTPNIVAVPIELSILRGESALAHALDAVLA
jgi:tetraacyldisaccharide 4'-kinase